METVIDPETKWYEEWFDRDEYELVYHERDEEEAQELVDLLERKIRPSAGSAILDVGCGRGRHALTLARRGYEVMGIDLSARAIRRARRLAAKEDLAVRFRVSDMRSPRCSGCFDGVVNLFTAFGYFEEEADHQRAVSAMAEMLRSGGWLFQDFLNAPHVEETLVPEDVVERHGAEIRQRRWIEDGRINKRIRIRRGGQIREFKESVRLLDVDDFVELYDHAGLELVQTFGDYDGGPHTVSSPRLILYARKGGD